ncbi:nucleoside 2-deoxyribosyltransferase [Clostridium botulinum]|uniref:nucleoside 2-deoxyribosyltransferase n=1 Tax=Clostridium botulinum TaxID=1491 RepID=UPI000774566E|nr:nucleoside 2-deoxyribosyltransferase [Clostridium botulinum]NFE59901.1 nucleoside 2-deoxyribosyltransferase [Clostridium botulinum]NFG10623.1 nucleoside 2-deoxyribosyltransferase [Clostridium botulinum]
MKRVYLASPFFNSKELDTIQAVEEILAEKDLHVFSPRLKNNQNKRDDIVTRLWSIETFTEDIKHLHWCECVVVVYHGNYSDSGTAFEIGYAYATGKPIILVHFGENSNLMCHEAAHANITLEELKEYDFEKMPTSFYEGVML